MANQPRVYNLSVTLQVVQIVKFLLLLLSWDLQNKYVIFHVSKSNKNLSSSLIAIGLFQIMEFVEKRKKFISYLNYFL